MLPALIGLLALLTMQIAVSTESDDATIKQAVLTVIGGNFSPDHLGPDKYETVKKMILDNSVAANRILISEILNREVYTRRLSSLYVSNLLQLTRNGDRTGALHATVLYQKILDDSLKEFDNAANKDAYFQGKSEQDKSKIQRLLQRKSEVKAFAETGSK